MVKVMEIDMLGWLWRVLIGSFYSPKECSHIWETEETRDLVNTKKVKIGVVKMCRCQQCGTWRRFDLDGGWRYD